MKTEDVLAAMPDLIEYTAQDGIKSFICPSEKLAEYAQKLRDSFSFETLSDLASLDNGANLTENRFSVVCVFLSHANKEYLRLKSTSSNGKFPSLTGVYKSANWQEREAFDLMGIVFEGHPNLKRILMWDAYPWHPLQKDFPLAGKEAPLPESFEGNETATTITPAPWVGGPFHSNSGEKFTADREPRSRQ
ncbi:MAG: NADH-quinone oxidoreductase subunit C [Opitutales bacterium]|nr:NADH-quinone oxidoreductase subunit C [Opitutales bacterium]